MQCPACSVDLVMSERQNIEIDYCPKCRGVWLDRGELDKIIEKSASEMAPTPQPRALQPAASAAAYERGHDHGHHGHKKPHRRKSWLEEIFD